MLGWVVLVPQDFVLAVLLFANEPGPGWSCAGIARRCVLLAGLAAGGSVLGAPQDAIAFDNRVGSVLAACPELGKTTISLTSSPAFPMLHTIPLSPAPKGKYPPSPGAKQKGVGDGPKDGYANRHDIVHC